MDIFEALSCGWAETHLGALWYLSPSQPWHSLSRLKACIMMTYKSHASRGVIKTPQYVPVAFCAAHLDERKSQESVAALHNKASQPRARWTDLGGEGICESKEVGLVAALLSQRQLALEELQRTCRINHTVPAKLCQIQAYNESYQMKKVHTFQCSGDKTQQHRWCTYVGEAK